MAPPLGAYCAPGATACKRWTQTRRSTEQGVAPARSAVLQMARKDLLKPPLPTFLPESYPDLVPAGTLPDIQREALHFAWLQGDIPGGVRIAIANFHVPDRGS